MIRTKEKKKQNATVDSFFLISVKLITIILGFISTRILSDKLSVDAYGTYSQIMLLVSTISSVTILGMSDGVNYFYCKFNDKNMASQYVSTIFSLQYIFSIIASVILLALTLPITWYFKNPDIKNLIIFAAIMPGTQNIIAILQVLFVSIGKAKTIALRNLIVSILRLIIFAVACIVFNSIAIILSSVLLLDIIQIVYFRIVLKKNNCIIKIKQTKKQLFKEILKFCIPMAIYLMVNSLSRDCDKYVISIFTNPSVLAIYSNASRILPFDIISASFCTVLLPYITKYIANEEKEKAFDLYKQFLELSLITTSIMVVAAIISAPELIQLLYTKKYLDGVIVFIIYSIVDIFRVFNITLILSAAGKTKVLVKISIIGLLLNVVLNIILFKVCGMEGPAIATLLVTIGMGILILKNSISSVLGQKLIKLFDYKYLVIFIIEIIIIGGIDILLMMLMRNIGVHYIIRLCLTCLFFGGVMILLNFKRIKLCLINISKK